MLRAAEEARGDRERPGLLGVTVLTSLGEDEVKRMFGTNDPVRDVAVRLALQARDAGLHGIVCSGREVADIRQACGPGLRTVVPGIRLRSEEKGDQMRVFTPGDAIRAGADYLVVGRPLTSAKNPKESLTTYLSNIEKAI
jgi:orotidine-5'-phosphate decarboxylase